MQCLHQKLHKLYKFWEICDNTVNANEFHIQLNVLQLSQRPTYYKSCTKFAQILYNTLHFVNSYNSYNFQGKISMGKLTEPRSGPQPGYDHAIAFVP